MDEVITDADLSGPSERRLRAMVHADVAGYSRLIGMNDAATVRRLRMLRRALIDPAIRAFRGRIVNTAGDSMMIMFDSVDAAVQYPVRLQQQVPVLDGDQPPERRIRFRVGINIGDVIVEGTDVHGDGANIAARLQSICPVGGICVSRAVRDHVQIRLGLKFEPLGQLSLKNIARPVEALTLHLDPTVRSSAPVASHRPWKRMLAGVSAPLRAGGAGMGWWPHRDAPKPVADATPTSAPVASALLPLDVGPPRLSLVVLPFDNLDSAPENSLADVITGDLTTALAQKVGLVVTARNSALTYKGRSVNIKLVGKELGVRYAVEGRDYTVRVEHGITKGVGGEVTDRDSWQTDNDAGPAERHGVVRVKVNEGSWLLEPSVSCGTATQATYQIYTDSGGVLPAFLANRASQMIIPKTVRSLFANRPGMRSTLTEPRADTVRNNCR